MVTGDGKISPIWRGDIAALGICGQETGDSGGVGDPMAYF